MSIEVRVYVRRSVCDPVCVCVCVGGCTRALPTPSLSMAHTHTLTHNLSSSFPTPLTLPPPLTHNHLDDKAREARRDLGLGHAGAFDRRLRRTKSRRLTKEKNKQRRKKKEERETSRQSLDMCALQSDCGGDGVSEEEEEGCRMRDLLELLPP